jgi:hypothetical protein
MSADIDWNNAREIVEAARPFDKSHDPTRPVMLAESEIVSFCRHHMAPRMNNGRRAADSQVAERVMALEQQIAALQEDKKLMESENTILRHRMMKDRRKEEVPVPFERRQFGYTGPAS